MTNFTDIGHGILLAALCLQFYNLGTIWLAQRVIYPLFEKVGAAEYVTYHRFYVHRIPLPIILPGFASFVMPIAVWATLPAIVPQGLAIANVAMGIVGLVVTVGLEIPRHTKLQAARDPLTIKELISYNWPRTFSISASAALVLGMFVYAFAAV